MHMYVCMCVICACTCFCVFFVQIPIGVAVDPGSMAFILNQTEAGVLVCDASMLDIVASNLVPQCPHLKYVIVMKAKCKENQEVMCFGCEHSQS